MGTTRVTKTSRHTSEEVERKTHVTNTEHETSVQDGGHGPQGSCAFDGTALAEELRAGEEAARAWDEAARAEEEAARADRRHEPPAPEAQPEDEQDVMLMDAKTLGRKGEDCAVRYLTLQGYEILERNWTCRFGEADIIALDPDGTLCLVEVKTRRSVEAGVPEAAVTPEKQRKYERIALTYLMDADFGDGLPVRFDCIGICVTRNRRAMLRHHKGCFDGLF